MWLQIIIGIIILATAIPVGMLLERITRDEKKFRLGFGKVIIGLSFIAIILSLVINIESKTAIIFTALYAIIICVMSLRGN